MIVFFIFCFSNQIKAFNDNDIIYLNKEIKVYENNVKKFLILCKNSSNKYLKRTWKTTYLEINSTNEFEIFESENADQFDELRRQNSYSYVYYSQKFLNMFFKWVRNEDTRSNFHQIYVPTFKNYCIGIDTLGTIKVELKDQNFDFKLIIYFLIGLALYFLSKPISRSEYCHYTTGISIGVFGSLLILFIIAIRYIPRKSTAAITLLSGGSFIALTLRWIIFNFKSFTDSLQMYLIYYIMISAFISWAYWYYRGPIRNERALSLIEIVLKIIGIILIYVGTSLKEISVLTIILIFSVKFLIKILNSKTVSKISYKLFPPKRRLLTHDEYAKESQEFTAKALRELQEYCKSPDCNTWKVVSRLKYPDRFAKFIDANEPHVNESEIVEYEQYSMDNDLDTDDVIDNDSINSNNNISNYDRCR